LWESTAGIENPWKKSMENPWTSMKSHIANGGTSLANGGFS